MATRPLAGTLLACAALALPAAADAQLPNGPLAAKGAEVVKNIAKHHDSAGARLHDGYFYITTERDLTIYDVSTPEDPKEVGHLDFPAESLQGYYFAEEDPDTNGEILITSNLGAIEVIDVRDKTAPKFLSQVAGTDPFPAQHTITCVLDCTWAYGSEGTVIDLRNPAKPRLAGDWTLGNTPTSFHDVTEVSPGIVLTSSQPMFLLDARTDPAHPTRLARVANADKRFNHANLWPNQMQDQIALVGGESSGANCTDSPSATFQTYDTSNWRESGTFGLLDEFRLQSGLGVDGYMAASTYCVHWFTPHPSYRNGGLVAISWYEHGTRFLQVGRDGTVTEVGWILPIGTTASAAYWVTDRILYVADYIRGLDVIKFTGEIVPGAPEGSPTARRLRRPPHRPRPRTRPPMARRAPPRRRPARALRHWPVLRRSRPGAAARLASYGRPHASCASSVPASSTGRGQRCARADGCAPQRSPATRDAPCARA